MAGPTRSAVAITDAVLSGFALDYGKNILVTESGMGMGNTADFIYPRVPHTIPGLTGEYYTYNRANYIELGDDNRKEGNYPTVTWNTSSATYRIEDKGFSTDYDDRTQEAAFAPLNLSEDAGEILPQRVLLAYANDVINDVTTTGNYNAGTTNTSTAAAVAQFGGIWTIASTQIVQQVNFIKRVIHLNSGVMPDSMVIGMDGWVNGILRNDDILAGLQAQQKSAGLIDFDPVQAIGRTFFDLDLRVDTTIHESANPTATSSPAYLFGSNAVIFVSNRKLQRAKALRFGFTVVRPGEFLRGYRWFESPHTNWRAVSFQRAIQLVEDSAAYLITSVV